MICEITIDFCFTAFAFGAAYGPNTGVVYVYVGPILVTVQLSGGRERDEDRAGVGDQDREQQ